MQEIRTVPMIPVNSPVGESESNGRVENAIGRIQDKIRVLRDQVEHNTKQKNPIYYNTRQGDAMLSNAIRYNAKQSNTTQCNTLKSKALATYPCKQSTKNRNIAIYF